MSGNILKSIRIKGKQKDRFSRNGFLRLLSVVICLLILPVMTACSENEPPAAGPAEIDLNSYIVMDEPEGYDGYGTMNAEMEMERLCDDLSELIRIPKDRDRQAEALKIAETVSKEFYLSNTQNLKNGDRVEIIWASWADEAVRLEQEYGISLLYKNASVSVNGLKATESIDPFTLVKVSFSGYDEYGTVSAEPSGNYGFSYTFSKTDHLSNGEVVRAEVLLMVDESVDDYAARTGIRVTSRTAEYTVEGLIPLREADPFEYITAEYSGSEPDGQAVFSYQPPEGFPDLSLAQDHFDGLSNGDTVTLAFSEGEAAETYEPMLGIRLTRLKGTFTVRGLSGYVNSLNSISEEGLTRIDTEFTEWVKNNDFTELGKNAELEALEIVGHFLLVSGSRPMDNYFGVVHKATVTDGKNKFVCYPFTFVTGLSLENGAYTADTEMLRTLFSVTEKGKKGTFTMYGAESIDEIKNGFLEPATQKFFERVETDF